jgi:hypothetical protein
MANRPPGNFDEEDLVDLEFDQERMRKEYTPSRHEKLRSFTVMCLIFNRSIGSGIFATPAKILRGTNSVGVNTVFWASGGLLTICGILVWLEFGLSIPREYVDGKDRAVPRSGGEKNYVRPIQDYNDPWLTFAARMGIEKAEVSSHLHVRYRICRTGKPLRKRNFVREIRPVGCRA